MISLRDVVTGFGNRDPLAEVWRRDLRGGGGGGGGAAVITGSLPLRYIGNGTPLTYYLIYGNTVQDGTPTPEAPVDVVGCGVWDETNRSYKLPLTVNGTEYPIYLGQVPTTRKIKKLVLTGEEDWRKSSVYSDGFFLKNVVTDYVSQYEPAYCSHFVQSTTQQDYTSGKFILTGDLNIRCGEDQLTLTDWTTWLFDQYAAGTPVTIWYVLEESETGIVNEPVHKIGDYADTISFAQAGVTIPTLSGTNILDTTSTVKPSEVYIKGKGIKPTGYGQLVDKNGVRILDKNDVRILVHGQ